VPVSPSGNPGSSGGVFLSTEANREKSFKLLFLFAGADFTMKKSRTEEAP
jgi:hypothetical protein